MIFEGKKVRKKSDKSREIRRKKKKKKEKKGVTIAGGSFPFVFLALTGPFPSSISSSAIFEI